MKCFLNAALIILSICSCSPSKQVASTQILNTRCKVCPEHFYPVSPMEYHDDFPLVDSGKLTSRAIRLLTKNQMMDFLHNENVTVDVKEINLSGGFTYLPVSISTSRASYKVTMDYMKYNTVYMFDDSSKIIGLKKVGVGLRLTALITTTKAGVNIGDLGSIGLAVSAGKATGTLTLDIIGIKSKDVTAIIPFPSEINQTTIQNAMQALATIKSKIYDDSTKLFPQVIAQLDYDLNCNNRDNSTAKNILDTMNKKDIESFLMNGGSWRDLSSMTENKLKNDNSNTTKMELIKKNEVEAFTSLLEQDVNTAIEKFQMIEKLYPTYHNTHEILKLLQKNKDKLGKTNNSDWIEVYDEILTDFSWGMPANTANLMKKKLIKNQ